MSTTKNKGGRPARAPGEKLQRINLTLRPAQLFALEVVARDRRTSLSQAAEYLIEQHFRTYEVEGVRASDQVDSMAERVLAFVATAPEDAPVRAMAKHDVVAAMLGSPAGRSLFMPQSLRLPSERYFAEFFEELLRGAFSQSKHPQLAKLFHMALVDPEKMDALLEASEMFEKNRIGIHDAATRYVELLVHVNT